MKFKVANSVIVFARRGSENERWRSQLAGRALVDVRSFRRAGRGRDRRRRANPVGRSGARAECRAFLRRAGGPADPRHGRRRSAARRSYPVAAPPLSPGLGVFARLAPSDVVPWASSPTRPNKAPRQRSKRRLRRRFRRGPPARPLLPFRRRSRRRRSSDRRQFRQSARRRRLARRAGGDRRLLRGARIRAGLGRRGTA